ncbi:MAG: MinD/ParA family protein [Acetobacteraceae bacterium]|nr:MinD/ParA family protein [Acetobacteraceae bacterium]
MTATTIMVASGKGGVGKTWFAITLAHCLARRGLRVLLFDADLGLANVDIQLGLLPERDMGGVLAGQCTLRQACSRHAGGFDILAGRSGSGELAGLGPAGWQTVLHLLAEAGRDYDRIVVDLGAGLDPFVRQMAAAADRLLVVATEEPTSLTDAYAVLKLHRQDRPKPRGPGAIVVNQASSPAAGQRVYETLARASAGFLGEMPGLAGVVRRDEKVREAIRRQSLLLARHPGAQAGADVEALAVSL